MRFLAAGKINLHLRVGPPTASGFHPLLSWMCTVGLFDILTIQLSDSASRQAVVSLSCDDPSLPTDERNLVVRAGKALAEVARNESKQLPPVGISLQKRIPSGAGLGGGSADAAFTLLALNRFWQLDLPLGRLALIAQELGSDVPFFLFGSSSICSGRGEFVEPIAKPKPRWGVLILPEMHLSTPEVYKTFDAMSLGSGFDAAIGHSVDLRQWIELSSEELLSRLINDLELPAFAMKPELSDLLVAARQLLDRPIRMSGSGSSLFTLFDRRQDAEIAAMKLAGSLRVRALSVELCPDLQNTSGTL